MSETQWMLTFIGKHQDFSKTQNAIQVIENGRALSVEDEGLACLRPLEGLPEGNCTAGLPIQTSCESLASSIPLTF